MGFSTNAAFALSQFFSLYAIVAALAVSMTLAIVASFGVTDFEDIREGNARRKRVQALRVKAQHRQRTDHLTSVLQLAGHGERTAPRHRGGHPSEARVRRSAERETGEGLGGQGHRP